MKDFGEREEKAPSEREGEAGGGGEGDPWFEPRFQEDPQASSDPAQSPLFRRLEPGESVPPPGGPAVSETEEGGWTEERARPRWRGPSWVREVVETALLALLIFLAVRASFQNFRVEGLSMEPSLNHGQYLIVNKLAYATIDLQMFDWLPFFDAGEDSARHLFGAPGRGDVVVFQSPHNPQQDFIKRIIAEPGDHIELRDGKVLLNGEALAETYAAGQTACFSGGQWCNITVPKGHYYVLGDNRPNSSDSRSFGPVPEELMIGKALISYWPLKDAGLAPNHSVSYAKDSTNAGE